MLMDREKRITVLGLGNTLLGDEGFGVHFITWFSELYDVPDNVSVVDGGTAGLGLLEIVTSAENLIVVDAIKVQDTPGSLYRFTKEDMSLYLPPPTSAHEVEFLDVLTMADLLGQCPQVVFLTIVPEKYDTMEIMISDVMVKRFPDMERLLLDELEALSVKAERKKVCTN
jgi:hydrogenase maturation protease